MSCAASGMAVRPPAGLVRVSFAAGLPGLVCSVVEGLELEAGAGYAVAMPEGERLGRLAGYEIPVLRHCPERVVGTVLRRASAQEEKRGEELRLVEKDALTFCRERARDLGLAMRPVAAVAPLNRDTIHISFAAEERVDFRELLRELTRRTRRKVELRQIGVRDQAKASGGWGPCGRPLCCSSFMARFTSVSIRMAKAQNLSLNPSRISGMCGRLMCCLAHEASEPAADTRSSAAG